MSVGAQSDTAGPAPAAGAGPAGTAAAQPDPAGRVLARLSVLPALLAMSWLIAGFPLLLIGHFTWVLTLVLSVAVVAVIVPLGLRWTPGLPAAARKAADQNQDGPRRTPWWPVVAVLVVAVAFGADQAVYHSEFIIVIRDPASYFQFAEWISRHGSLPISQDRAAFGGANGGGLTFGSYAYYQVGTSIVPQFMAGLPMVLAGAMWAGGANAALLAPAVLGAAALLAFGGLTARLVGARWAPLAVLALAVSLPEQFTSRSDYSEPLAQILFLGGLCLVVDSLGRDRAAGGRVLASIAGLALGLTVLVRIDGTKDILPALPYCGLLLLGRRRQALPLLGGVLIGAAFGLIDGLVFSRPYLKTNESSLKLLELAAALVLVVTLVALPLLWKRGLPQVRGRWLPAAVSALTVLIVIVFAVRPYVTKAHAVMDAVTQQVIVQYQQANHQPVDGSRTYAETSLHWVFWYVGIPVVILATAGAAVLARHCLRGRAPLWTLPLMTFAWTIVTFLYQPAITPDQPWASRRLVPAVLPGFILLAVWASARLVGGLGEHEYPAVLRRGSAVVLAAALILPAAITTFGLSVTTGGPVGLRLNADGVAFKTTYAGELSAIDGVCASIPDGSSVIFIDGPLADRVAETIRGMCDVPVARLTVPGHPPAVAAVQQAIQDVRQAGRRPVLFSATASELKPFGGFTRKVMTLNTRMDASTLVAPPTTTMPLSLTIWMGEPA